MQMKSNLKKLKDCRFALAVEVDSKEVDAKYREVFLEISRKARIPGFRAGKAPMDLVEKNFLDTAKEEVVKSLVSRAYADGLQKHQARAVSYPQVKEVRAERGKNLTFVAEFDTEPDLKLKKYSGLKIRRPSDSATDADIHKALDGFRESRAAFAPLKEPRPVMATDCVRLKVAHSGSAEDAAAAPTETEVVVPKDLESQGPLAALIGAGVGDEREIKGGDGKTYATTVLEIKAKELPAMDEAFAQSFGQPSLEKLREEVSKDLQRYYRHQSREVMKNQVVEKLLAENSFAVPESLVERQKKAILERSLADAGANEAALSKMPPEELKKLEATARQKAEEQVRLYFILERIAEESKIEVDDSELERRIQEIAAATRRDPEEIRHGLTDDVRHQLRQDKAMDSVLASASLSDVPRETEKA